MCITISAITKGFKARFNEYASGKAWLEFREASVLKFKGTKFFEKVFCKYLQPKHDTRVFNQHFTRK